MRLLLDTHAALWWRDHDPRLSETALDQLIDDANEVLLSAAVVWEVTIKRRAGKLNAPADVAQGLLPFDVSALPITVAHAAATETLPDHHRDPFDRMLVAQAMVERATIVSRDPILRRYDVPVLW